MTDTIPAPSPVTTETVPSSPAPSAEKTETAGQLVSPQASETEPAGQEQQPPDLKTSEPEEPTEGQKRRKERNQQRWREMKAAASEVERLRAERALYAPRQVDYTAISDPDEVLAEKTAAKLTEQQRAIHDQRIEVATKAQERALFDAWDGIKADMRERVPDFDQVVNDRTPIHQRAAPFIVESEKGGDIAYFLGKHPDVARDLFQKFETAPAQALIELGRIEARLSAAPPKAATQAPRPAPVLSGGANPLAFDQKTAGVADIQAQLKKAGVIR